MVPRQHIAIQVHTRAKANAVYALLRDGASWLTWTSIESFKLMRHSEGARDRLAVALSDRAIHHPVRAWSCCLRADRKRP